MERKAIRIPDIVEADNFRGQFSILKCRIGMTFEEVMRLLEEQHITFQLSEHKKNYKEISTSDTLQKFFIKNEYEGFDLVIYGTGIVEGFCFNWWKSKGLNIPRYISYADEYLVYIKQWLSGSLQLPSIVKKFSREEIKVVYGLRKEVAIVRRTPEDVVIDICRFSDYQERDYGLIKSIYYLVKNWITNRFKKDNHSKI